MTYIGFDFSLCKPAATVYHDGKIIFYAWPNNISGKSAEMLKNAGVNVYNIPVLINKKPDNITEVMQYNLLKANNLADIICASLSKYLSKDTFIAQEGLSYGSVGASSLELAGYKYILMNKLNEYTPYRNMFTYAPLTIKSVAGCSKKGEGTKEHMINSFIKNSSDTKFKKVLSTTPELLKKKINYIECVDDIVDSYFVLQTMLEKNIDEIKTISNMEHILNK